MACIVDKMTGDCKGDRNMFIDHCMEKVKATREKIEKRQPLEGGNWQDYIDFELSEGNAKRALCLIERQMSQSLENLNDVRLFMKYIHIISNELKDSSLARAQFEQKLKFSVALPATSKIDILIHSAQFEEL